MAVEYKEEVTYAAENSLPKPRVNNYIGGCFLKIATHLSYRPNFINYMYKDDMVCDGIENVFNILTTLILLSQRIHLRILHRLYTMLSSGVSPRKKTDGYQG